MPPSRATPFGNGPDQPHADTVHLEVTRDADRPGKIASREPLAKRCAQPVTGICQHTAEAHTGRDHAIDLSQGNLWLGPCSSAFDRNARSPQPHPVVRRALGKEMEQGEHHRTSPRASVSDTSVWQLAVLPSAEAYCAPTP